MKKKKFNFLEKIIKLLPEDSRALRLACTGQETDLLSHLAGLGSESEFELLKRVTFTGISLPHLCAFRGWKSALSWLSLRKITIAESDLTGRTPLHVALNPEIFQHLLKRNCDPFAQDIQGRSAAMMPYIRGWAQFEAQKITVEGKELSVAEYEKKLGRKYYPLPQWSDEVSAQIWDSELSLVVAALKSNLEVPEQDPLPKALVFLENAVRSQLSHYIKDRIAQTPLPYDIIKEPKLSGQWSCVANQALYPGQIVAIYVGAVGAVGVDTPNNPSYTFIQGDYFVDASLQGGSAECINDSFPNLTTVTMDEKGVSYTVLVAIEPIKAGEGLYYYYGPTHPMTHHIELNEKKMAEWAATHRIATHSTLHQRDPWKKIEEMTKRQYLKGRYGQSKP